MMRALYIIGICFSVLLGFLVFYYTVEYYEADWRDYSSRRYDDYSYSYGNGAAEVTAQAGMVTLLFFLYFTFVDIMGLIKIKRMTTRVLAIIGLSFALIMILWDALMISSPRNIDFDEVAPAWFIYAIIMLAFSIVGLVQAVKNNNKEKLPDFNDEVIDEIF